jgi:hypothetical protein
MSPTIIDKSKLTKDQITKFGEGVAAALNKKKTNPTLPDIKTEDNKSKNKKTDIQSLISSSTPAVDTDYLERINERQRKQSNSGIRSQFGQKIKGLEQDRDTQTRATEGQLGTRRKFSSSAQAFISFQEDQVNKQIATLEVAMENAVIDNDIEYANLLLNRIDKERTEARQVVEDSFRAIELQQALEDYEFEKNQPSRELAVHKLIEQGITDVGKIQDTLSTAKINTTAEEIESLVDVYTSEEEGSGLAKVVFENPTLFNKLSNSQLGEILTDLNDMGFDFQGAIDMAAKSKVVGSVTTSQTIPFEEWKNSEEAQQTIASMEARGLPVKEVSFVNQVLKEKYDRLVSSGELTTEVQDSEKNFTATNIPTNVKNDLVEDIGKVGDGGYTLIDIIKAYPDVSDSYIRSLAKALEVKDSDTGKDLNF